MKEVKAIWYYAKEENELSGPFTAEQVLEQCRLKRIGSTTPCWKEGMAKWEPLNNVEPFAGELARAEALAKKRLMKILVLSLAVIVIIVGAALSYRLIMGPAKVRRAKKLMSRSLYGEASGLLESYLKTRPDEDSSVYLLAIAKLKAYATADRGQLSRRRAGFGNSGLGDVEALLRQAIALNASWVDRAAEDAAKASSMVSAAQKDSLERLLAISRLRAELKLADQRLLAGQLMDHAQDKYGSYGGQDIKPEIVSQILMWDSSLSGRVVELILGSGEVLPTQLASWARGLQRTASHLPTSATGQLTVELLRRASDLIGEGKYDLAEIILRTVAQIDKGWGGEVAKLRHSYLKSALEAGKTDFVIATLDRTCSESSEMQERAAELYVVAARYLKGSDAGSAWRLFQKALKLDPEVADGEEDIVLFLELAQPDETKLRRSQFFLKDYPASQRRGEVLRIIVNDAVTVFDSRRGWVRNNDVPVYLRTGFEAAKELLEKHSQMDGADVVVFELAKRFAKNGQSEDALNLVSRLLEVVGDSAIRIDMEQAKAQWRSQSGRGTLSEQMDSLADRVERALRVDTLVTPAALSAILAEPGQGRVIQVSDGCTKENFSTERADMLRAWVADGGILWANNNVLSLFGIGYGSGGWGLDSRYECTAAVAAELCPVMTGCTRVVVSKNRPLACNMTYPKVIPLLNSSRYSETQCFWSLVKYGKGWISDVKTVDTTKYDGARFWLNFRLFLLGWDIPDAPAGAREYAESFSAPSSASRTSSDVAPADMKIADSADALEQALADPNNCRILWVRIPQARVGLEKFRRLREWVRGGGILWLDTDLARSFGFTDIEKAPLLKGRAKVAPGGHPAAQGIVGETVDFELGLHGMVISGRLRTILKSKVEPLLVQDTNRNGVVNCVCGIRDYGKGYVLFRPSKIDTRSKSGKRFGDNLHNFIIKLTSAAEGSE